MTEIVHHSPMSFDQKTRQAELLAAASLIPSTYKKNPANVYVAIEMGEALGIHPMVAINEINVISGTPAPSASLMAALARNAGHKVRVTGDAERAVCTIIRSDDPDFEHTATWDVAKAKAAGLWGRGHWAKDPGTMLRWRAISECVRMACSEVLGGLKYTPEEVLSFSAPTPQAPAPESQEPRTIRRKQAEEVVTVEEVQAPQEDDAVTRDQIVAIGEYLDTLEVPDDRRNDALNYYAGQVNIGRELESAEYLTQGEAATLIAFFAQGGA